MFSVFSLQTSTNRRLLVRRGFVIYVKGKFTGSFVIGVQVKLIINGDLGISTLSRLRTVKVFEIHAQCRLRV